MGVEDQNVGAAGGDADYCEKLVRRRDEDRWLSAQYAPAAVREKLIAIYALHQEICQIPAAVSEPPLGEIRLQWWREALEEIVAGSPVRAHPVVGYAAAVGAITAANKQMIDTAIDARAHLLYGEPFATVDAFWAWLDQAEGYLAAARMSYGDGEPAPTQEDHAALVRAESAFSAGRDAGDLSKTFAGEILAGVHKPQAAVRPLIKAMSAEAGAMHLHLTLIGLRSSGAHGPFTALQKRVRLFKAMLTGRI